MRPISIALMASANQLFKKTIEIGGSMDPVNLSMLAIAAGYTGNKPAEIVFNVVNGATLNAGIIGGVWPDEELNITLNVIGAVYGAAGAGGAGGTPHPVTGFPTDGSDGGVGGDAINCTIPMTINVAATGQIKAGGGGGGGGGGWTEMVGPIGEEERVNGNGGAGGSGFPNQTVGEDGIAFGTGDGGSGGAAATAGGIGAAATRSGDATNGSGGNGGASGWAIRKNGYTVPVTNAGIIQGTEA